MSLPASLPIFSAVVCLSHFRQLAWSRLCLSLMLAQLLVLFGLVLFVQFQFACAFHDDLVRAAMHADNGIEQAAELVQPDMDGGIGYLATAGLVVVVRIERAGRHFAVQPLTIIGQEVQHFTGPKITVRLANSTLHTPVIG